MSKKPLPPDQVPSPNKGGRPINPKLPKGPPNPGPREPRRPEK